MPDEQTTLGFDKLPRSYSRQFEAWWKLYPRKINKSLAFKAFQKAIRIESFEVIMRHTLAISESPKGKGKFCPHPTTYLNGQRWGDDPQEWTDAREAEDDSDKWVF